LLRVRMLLVALVSATAFAHLSSADAYRLVEELFSESGSVRRSAREQLIAGGDVTIAPALVEVIFFSSAGRADAIKALENLLGEKHGSDFEAWVEAIGRREDIQPKPGYVGFKASQYARIDPAFAAFLKETHPRTIRVEEIMWGGVRKDAIPALRNPKRIPAAQATYLRDDEMVFGVSLNGETRAYPLRILDWHEMANDVIGGRAVSLAYCTLCGAGILYDTTLGDGETYTFGSSGLLYRSNKLMYDHQTNTLWSHLHGEPVMGPLVGKGKRLRILPMTLTTWGEWRRRHPASEVLSLETGYQRRYVPGAAYGEYFRSPELMFPVWKKAPNILQPKDWIFALEIHGARKAYPLRALLRNPVLNDVVAGNTVVLVTDRTSEAVRAYLTSGRQLRSAQNGRLIDRKTGELFSIEEEYLVNSGGTVRLARAAGHRAYWFGWYAFFPGTEIYQHP
jgi:hypothetical protein